MPRTRFTERPLRRPRKHQNIEDAVGRVRVQITLLGANGVSHVRGNIVRSFQVRGTTVSSVAMRVERALFEG